jgi:peptidoglycan hydrolase-like protein with peptidoglycan-binding domain
MTAQISGFISRAQWGARPPRSVSHNITPQNGGCSKHYGGAGAPPATHDGCAQRWKSWQNYHMDSHRWSDIAYTAGYCNHGYVYAGRGYGVRTAANGTNSGNQNWYAFTWIGGGNAQPTQQAYDARDWLVYDARKHGGAGNGFNNHKDHFSTSCPGPHLSAYKLGSSGATPPTQPPPGAAPPFPFPNGHWMGVPHEDPRNHSGYYSQDRPGISQYQQQMRNRGWSIGVDGQFGDQTRSVTISFQQEKGLAADGLAGISTWNAAFTAPVT